MMLKQSPWLVALSLFSHMQIACASEVLAISQPTSGQWEIRTTFNAVSSAMPFPLPPKVVSLCLAKDDFASSKFALQSMPGCDAVDGKIEGNLLKLRLKCTNPNVQSAEGRLTINTSVGITGQVLVNMGKDENGKNAEFVYGVEAKRTGDCSK